MVSEIVDIIVKVFEGIKKENSLKDVEKLLLKRDNYHKNLVSAAYSWIYDKSVRDNLRIDDNNMAADSGFRILSSEEKFLLGDEVEKYLMCLYNIGLLKNNDIEKIIEQVQLFPENTQDVDNIKLLILSLFFDTDNISTPGSRYILYSSDTVN
ncbi:MAG: DUF494 family protein [Ignavibacteriaceae bacterium]|nr:DUF494 family protein [Ignavibacteriaceae bacterium]